MDYYYTQGKPVPLLPGFRQFMEKSNPEHYGFDTEMYSPCRIWHRFYHIPFQWRQTKEVGWHSLIAMEYNYKNLENRVHTLRDDHPIGIIYYTKQFAGRRSAPQKKAVNDFCKARNKLLGDLEKAKNVAKYVDRQFYHLAFQFNRDYFKAISPTRLQCIKVWKKKRKKKKKILKPLWSNPWLYMLPAMINISIGLLKEAYYENAIMYVDEEETDDESSDSEFELEILSRP